MMTINQSALATAVINITGNTQGLQQAIGETKKQMHGFLVFAQAMGGRTGGFLANMLAMGGARPALGAILGQRVGGAISDRLVGMGVMQEPIQDIDKAMKQAQADHRRRMFQHKMTGAGIQIGGAYNGQPINTPADLAAARAQHSLSAPKLSESMEKFVPPAAKPAQELALLFGRLGSVVNAAYPVFKKLLESGTELQRQMIRATRVFGPSIGAAMGGFEGFGANMSRSEFAAGASGIGLELAQNGVGGRQSASMSSNLARRAGEIAAAWGDEFANVVAKIQSAVAGSDGALKEFGVILSDDLVRAKAFNSGMIKFGETMSAQIAAQARYDLIMSQTSDAVEDASASFFSLSNQWKTTTSGLSTAMEMLGAALAPIAATVLGIGNAAARFAAILASAPFRLFMKGYNYVTGSTPDADGGDGRADLGRANDDAKRADDVLRRERARQSSNVGYHAPEDFYNHIQKGIFGDPMEFAKRQTDLMHEFVIVSKEQLEALRDFGYKVVNASGLIQP